ncbi:MAG TPA: protease modulator HflC [Thermotogota bacterium]|nr:protease modulator HflC [Thermotogota bacterium]HRW91774.1 protease modulator HflC [Thermotogota bacterium]
MKTLIWGIVLLVLFFIAFGLFTYSVDETEYAIRLRFGKIMSVHETAGLHLKAPFVDQILKREKRIQLYDISPESILTTDKKRLEVDTFVLWKIEEPQLFLETMRTENNALNRIDDIVYSNIRDMFAKVFIKDIISESRREYLATITQQSQETLAAFGINVQDVNVKRTDLPDANAKAVFERMKSERNKAAAKIRAEGEMSAKDIVADADRQAGVIVAEAQKTAEDIKGEGDARSVEIYAEAFSKDPDFYAFWRTLQAYENTLRDDTYLVLGDDLPFLQELFNIQVGE